MGSVLLQCLHAGGVLAIVAVGCVFSRSCVAVNVTAGFCGPSGIVFAPVKGGFSTCCAIFGSTGVGCAAIANRGICLCSTVGRDTDLLGVGIVGASL